MPTRSKWAQLIACYLTAPSHYQDQCWHHQMCSVAFTWEQSLQWHHNGHDGVSNHQPRHWLLDRLFRRRSQKTSKLRVTGICAANSTMTGEFRAPSNTENISSWWRHHDAARSAHEFNLEYIFRKVYSEKLGPNLQGANGLIWYRTPVISLSTRCVLITWCLLVIFILNSSNL